MQIQNDLRQRVVLETTFSEVRTIAGADIAVGRDENRGYAGVIVYEFPSFREIERAHAVVEIKFPYVPGLLVFREGPALLAAFEKIKTEPDIIIFDGQGLAHPRRMGIATHMGIILDKPTIGCAKSRLTGTFYEPGPNVGDYSPLMDGEETIGAVLRTRENVNPIFVSQGHKIDLPKSIEIIMQCLDGYRIPKPTREADKFVGQVKAGKFSEREGRQLSLGFD